MVLVTNSEFPITTSRDSVAGFSGFCSLGGVRFAGVGVIGDGEGVGFAGVVVIGDGEGVGFAGVWFIGDGEGVGLDGAGSVLVKATPKVKGPFRSFSGLNCKFSFCRSLSAQLLGYALVFNNGVDSTPATGVISKGLARG